MSLQARLLQAKLVFDLCGRWRWPESLRFGAACHRYLPSLPQVCRSVLTLKVQAKSWRWSHESLSLANRHGQRFQIFLGSLRADSMIPFVDNALRYATGKSILRVTTQ